MLCDHKVIGFLISNESLLLDFFFNVFLKKLFWWVLDADMEDYGFEYSEEEPEEQDVDIENQYYNSKGKAFRVYDFFF